MSLVMVVDDMAVVREPIAMSLRAAGYLAVCASNGQDALGKIRAQRPDLILLDMGMPVMDGLGFLRALRAEFTGSPIPVICLTAQADRECVVEAAKLGARDYMLKTRFSMTEMLARIRNRLESPKNPPAPLASPPRPAASVKPSPEPQPGVPRVAERGAGDNRAASGAPQPSARIVTKASTSKLLTRDESLKRVETAAQEKTMSGCAARVMAVAATPSSDLPELSSLIARDPTLATRILRAANSAAFGKTGGIVVTIPEAVRKMGFGGVRNLAASAAVLDVMPASLPNGFSAGRWWSHTLAVAVLSERLATAAAPEMAGAAYLVGLCHDLGELIFHDVFAGEYPQILEAHQATGQSLQDLEMQMLGITAPELIGHILSRLGLPEAIRIPIAVHQAAVRNGAQPSDPLARTLWLADFYCNGMLLASSLSSPIRSFARAFCKQVTGADVPVAPSPEEFRGEILGLTLSLARLSAKDESELLTPLFARTPARVWLARDSRLSSFDPIEAALTGMAEVSVQDHLPSHAEMAKCDAIVIASQSVLAKRFSPQDVSAVAGAGGTPMLWLTDKNDLPIPEQLRVKPRVWPIPLDAIADFVRQIQCAAGEERAGS